MISTIEKNPFAFKIESLTGSLLILALAGFFAGLFFILSKNLESEAESFNYYYQSSELISAGEKEIMTNWAEENGVDFLPTRTGLKKMLQDYTQRP